MQSIWLFVIVLLIIIFYSLIKGTDMCQLFISKKSSAIDDTSNIDNVESMASDTNTEKNSSSSTLKGENITWRWLVPPRVQLV